MTNGKRPLWRALADLWQDKCRRTALLIWVRYALPLLSAPVLLLLGAFYNVSAMQLGRPVKVSVLRLLFNTLKSARTYLLSDTVSDGVRNFYLFLIVGAVLLLLFFLLSLAVSVFALYTLRRVQSAARSRELETAKEAKILFCAFIPNRTLLFILNFAVLPLALFPELFSFICSRFLTVSGSGSLYVRFNPVLLVVGLLLLATLALAVALRRCECAVGLDLFAIDEEDDDDGDDEAHDEGEEEAGSDADHGADGKAADTSVGAIGTSGLEE